MIAMSSIGSNSSSIIENGQPYYNSDPNQQYNNQGTYYDPNRNNNNNG